MDVPNSRMEESTSETQDERVNFQSSFMEMELFCGILVFIPVNDFIVSVTYSWFSV